MIKIFRKIRKKLPMPVSPVGRYLLYAIGEIVLVVIGILIALQINNANESQKEKEELSKIYESIIEELNTDIVEAEKVVSVFTWKTKVMNRIIKNQVSDEEWLQNDSVLWSFAGATPDFAISKERYTLLKQKADLNEETRKLNNQIADFYHQFSVDIIACNENFDESFYSDISYWRANTTWFSKYLVEKDRAAVLAYAKTNPSFRNRIVYKRIVMSRLGSVIQNYREGAEVLKTKIKSYLNTSQ